MPDSTVFDKLVRNLSQEERQSFLRQISRKSEAVDVVDPQEIPEESPGTWEKVYEKYGFFKKLFLALTALFSGKKLGTLVKERMLADLGTSIERQVPGLVNFRSRVFFPGFHEELRRLFGALEVFRKPFNTALGPHKGDFYAFMVGLELPDTQLRLLEETNPGILYENSPERTTKDIKSILDGNLRVIMDSIPQESRKRLYERVKSLQSLRQLVHLNEDRYLGPFMIVTQGGGAGNANLEDLKVPLQELWERLMNLPKAPPTQYLEALFLFHLQEQWENQEVNLEELTSELMEKAQYAIDSIRDFNKRVPLGRIVAYLNGQLSLEPRVLGGGEDWFTIYRKFWQTKLDTDFQVFAKERAERTLMSDVYSFLDISPEDFRKDPFYPPYFPGRVPTPGEKAFLFLRAFYTKIFQPKMNPVFKLILLEGEFYKKNNRAVFTECYNTLLQIPDKLNFFQKNLGPEGEWGRSLVGIDQGGGEESAINRVKDVFYLAGDWALSVLHQSFPVVQNFLDVLKGINRGDAGGSYDTLANLGSLAGKNNGNFRKELNNLCMKWEKFLTLIRDLMALDQ